MSRYLTLVVRLADNADGRLVFEQVERINGVTLSASSWSHAMDARDTLTADLARLTAELEKEKAQSRHLAEAMSRKIDELIAAENQCSHYKAQYTRAEQTRKEACDANVKAQADMLWATAELERKQRECERLREALRGMLRTYNDAQCSELHHKKADQHASHEPCPVRARREAALDAAEAALSAGEERW